MGEKKNQKGNQGICLGIKEQATSWRSNARSPTQEGFERSLN